MDIYVANVLNMVNKIVVGGHHSVEISGIIVEADLQ